MNWHLLAFKLGRQSDEREDYVGLLGGCDCIFLKQARFWNPFKRDTRSEERSFMQILDAQLVRLCVRRRSWRSVECRLTATVAPSCDAKPATGLSSRYTENFSWSPHG